MVVDMSTATGGGEGDVAAAAIDAAHLVDTGGGEFGFAVEEVGPVDSRDK